MKKYPRTVGTIAVIGMLLWAAAIGLSVDLGFWAYVPLAVACQISLALSLAIAVRDYMALNERKQWQNLKAKQAIVR